MRKQTKLVAVLSAAALLAIGASMTSFAAWSKSDDGTWQYFDRDGEMIAGEWQKDGAKWFYLDDDGNMLTDSWVEDEYYVGDDGAMLINTWKKTLADEDISDPEDDGDNWYYFGSKGKKTIDTDKKINGKTYYFDENGKMKDGWYPIGDNVYYLGDEDDGARKSGWLWLEAPEEDDVSLNAHSDDCATCDDEGWYNFGSDGKMFYGAGKKKINGKYYFFNDHGQMLYEWINNTQVKGTPTNAVKDGDNEGASPSEMIYSNVVEEGWRADGWYQIDGAEDTGADSDTDWYFFKDGKAKMAESTDIVTVFKDNGNSKVETGLHRAKIKVNGKYFCFNEIGQMQDGLQYIPASGGGFYYFDANGYMKTGKVSSVEEDNDSFTYYFETKNGKLGKGVTGEKSGYLYWNGKRLEADDDYRFYAIPNGSATDFEYYLVNKSGKLQKSTKKYTIENNDVEVEVVAPKSGYKFSGSTKVGTSTVADIATYPTIELYDGILDAKAGIQETKTTEE